MFKLKKEVDLKEVDYHPGIYQMELPYLLKEIRDNDDVYRHYYCDIEIHVGDKRDLENGILITAIISDKKETPGVTQSIERIAEKLMPYFDVITNHQAIFLIHNRIRFIEKNFEPNKVYHRVEVKWDDKKQCFDNPKWTNLDENDWIIVDRYNNKHIK